MTPEELAAYVANNQFLVNTQWLIEDAQLDAVWDGEEEWFEQSEEET